MIFLMNIADQLFLLEFPFLTSRILFCNRKSSITQHSQEKKELDIGVYQGINGIVWIQWELLIRLLEGLSGIFMIMGWSIYLTVDTNLIPELVAYFPNGRRLVENVMMIFDLCLTKRENSLEKWRKNLKKLIWGGQKREWKRRNNYIWKIDIWINFQNRESVGKWRENQTKIAKTIKINLIYTSKKRKKRKMEYRCYWKISKHKFKKKKRKKPRSLKLIFFEILLFY